MARPTRQTAASFLTPVARTTVTSDVCSKLSAHLIRGDWAEGDRLPPERELCRQLGVGRASLREALKALEIMGLIESRVGEGTFVRNRSEFLSQPLLWAIAGSEGTDVREILEARLTMEVALAGFAAERATTDDLKEIGSHIDRMAEAGNDKDGFLRSDVGFHLAIAKAAHNQILLNAVQLIRNLMQQWINQALRVEGAAREAIEQHKAIFLAIAKKQPDKARSEMARHLTAMGQRFAEAQGGTLSGSTVATKAAGRD